MTLIQAKTWWNWNSNQIWVTTKLEFFILFIVAFEIFSNLISYLKLMSLKSFNIHCFSFLHSPFTWSIVSIYVLDSVFIHIKTHDAFFLLLLLLLWSTWHCKQRRLSFLTWLSFREYQLPRRGAHWLFSLRDLVSRAHKSLPELTSKHLLSFLESFFFFSWKSE